MRIKDEIAIEVRKAVNDLIKVLDKAGQHSISVSVTFFPTEVRPYPGADSSAGIGTNWNCRLGIYHREDL